MHKETTFDNTQTRGKCYIGIFYMYCVEMYFCLCRYINTELTPHPNCAIR